MNSIVRLLLLALLFYCSAQCTSKTENSWTRELIDPDSVRVVENGPRPQEWFKELPVLRIQEEVVIGRDEGPEEYLLSFQPSGRWLSIGPAGQIAYTEHRPPELRVYDSSGRILRRIGRAGDGPGEFRLPIDPAYSAGIGWIVHDPRNVRLSVFSETGEFIKSRSLGQLPLGQSIRTIRFCPDSDFWYMSARVFERNESMCNGFHVMWTDWGTFRAVEVDTFEQLMITPRGKDKDFHNGYPLNLEIDDHGRAWINVELSYQIEIYEPGGAGHWRIRREHNLVDYPPEYRKNQESLTVMESPEETWYIKLPPMQPAIAGLKWVETGEMWVFTSAYVDSPMVQVDVFNPDGEYVRAFLADRRLKDMPISTDFLYKTDTTESGSPILVRCSYYFEPQTE